LPIPELFCSDLELDSERASANLTHQTVRKNISLKLKPKTEGKSKKKDKKKSEKKINSEGGKLVVMVPFSQGEFLNFLRRRFFEFT
jgi:hypothetical protein